MKKVALVVLLLCSRAFASDPNIVIWPNAVDTKYELRAGVEYGVLEGYIAPNYDVTLDVFGLRAYGIYNAVDTEMAANWLGATTPLPDGKLYGGIFGGWKFKGDQMEAGWLVGGRVEIKPRVSWTTEYQQSFTEFKEDSDRYAFVTGLRIALK